MHRFLFQILFLFWVPVIHAQTILPTPQFVQPGEGIFSFRGEVKVNLPKGQNGFVPYLKEVVLPAAGGHLKLSAESSADLVFTKDASLSNEAYVLEVRPKKIHIAAAAEQGFFYGVESLYQLLLQKGKGQVPCVVIRDAPRYRWRSFLLDCGRQYYPVATIKKYLDMMAMLKMNVFHWHLTEGMGWRLEIKKYPELTAKGAFIGQGAEQQGFYTQEDAKEIVRYAAERYITVMPEIDMPGHSEAALQVFPQYSCFGQVHPLKENLRLSGTVFCAGKPSTMQFLRDVLDEVCAVFPSPYIHVGGDEVPKANWDSCADCQALIRAKGLAGSEELQVYFSSEIARYLKTKGRKAVFWDEVIMHDGYALPDNVVIHWWNYRSRRERPFTASLAKGHEVICGTNYFTYLNFPVTPWKGYQENRTFDIQDAYERNPSRNRDSNALVLGMSCALWGDYNVRASMVDQRLFPRIFALAEQMWHKGHVLSFDEFYKQVLDKKSQWEKMGYRFGPGLKSEVIQGYSWQ